jgi:formate dehydrogenase major subunit
MYIDGREPGDVRPRRTTRARRWPARPPGRAGHLPHRDRALADVVLPASRLPREDGTFTNTDRRCRLGRQALAAGRGAAGPVDHPADRPAPGPRLALQPVPSDVFDEMRRRCLASPASPGSGSSARARSPTPAGTRATREPVVFVDASHEGRPRALSCRPTSSRRRAPDAEYPMVLITGRQLEHWHTGSMTRRARCSTRSSPTPWRLAAPADLAALGVPPGEWSPSSRAAAGSRCTRAPTRARRAARCSSLCLLRGGANLLTNPALDPFGKIPEFKYCA